MLTPRRAEDEFRWQVSSYSPNTGGNCVEVGSMAGEPRIAVRDSKNRNAGMLVIASPAWAAFVRKVAR